MKADTAALSSPLRSCSADAIDDAVASCASPTAENPTAMTDRVSSAMTAMAAILYFIGLASRIWDVHSVNFAQFYTGPSAIASIG